MQFRVIALLSSLWLGFGCRPSAGSACDTGEARCIDAKTELACQVGHFIETPCRGAHGCALTPQGTNCDFSGNKPGEACSTDDEGAAVCPNKDNLLACHGGVYTLLPCRGSKGCVSAAGRALCDTSLAEQGDACHDENLKACSVDGAQVLICKQHTMQRFYLCRGPNGCASSGGKLSCDTSVAKLGDACDKKLEGQAASCAPDGSAVLACKGGAFTIDEPCKAGQKCSALAGSTRCVTP